MNSRVKKTFFGDNQITKLDKFSGNQPKKKAQQSIKTVGLFLFISLI